MYWQDTLAFEDRPLDFEGFKRFSTWPSFVELSIDYEIRIKGLMFLCFAPGQALSPVRPPAGHVHKPLGQMTLCQVSVNPWDTIFILSLGVSIHLPASFCPSIPPTGKRKKWSRCRNNVSTMSFIPSHLMLVALAGCVAFGDACRSGHAQVCGTQGSHGRSRHSGPLRI